VAEVTTVRIESHTQVVGFLAHNHIADKLGKSEHRRGIQSRRIAHRTIYESVVAAKYQRISIYKKKSWHIFSSLCTFCAYKKYQKNGRKPPDKKLRFSTIFFVFRDV
jgi:hypothetical protein